jgi:hypothetical protein
MIAGVLAEIQIEHLQNTNLELYHYTNLFGRISLIICFTHGI